MSAREVRVPGTDLGRDRGVEVAVGEGTVAVFRDGGQVRAFDGSCPHLGGPLAEGWIRDGCLHCPWHGWRFDVDTGISPQNDAMRVRVHRAHQRDDGTVAVEVSDAGDAGA